LRQLLTEKVGGHFSFNYKMISNLPGEILKLNKFFCIFSAFGGGVARNHIMISIPSRYLCLRKKSGISGYSNIIKSCCSSNLKSNKLKNIDYSIIYSSYKRYVGEVENSYFFISIPNSSDFNYKNYFYNEENILNLRKYIISSIKNPNPNIAKYIN
jgi:hypothetical protein